MYYITGYVICSLVNLVVPAFDAQVASLWKIERDMFGYKEGLIKPPGRGKITKKKRNLIYNR